jgi:phenylalanyl-tRNA synthetase beta chain|tara:strand:- start:1283 stop:3064 length:1782 start_codon:yes stop_codon:yes gene_type:complete
MRRLGKEYTETEFDELCFEFGIELDEVTSEKQIKDKFLGEAGAGAAGAGDDAEDDTIYKIDIPANRYDLLCMEGISRALNVFRGVEPSPVFRMIEPANGAPRQKMIQKPETMLVRPFVVCAVLRGVKFDKARYDSFIDLQDKLHQNICRRRTLVAIGTHDLNTVKGPFTYEAHPPEDIKFTPLKQTREFNAAELMEHYKSDQKLKHFLHIIDGSVVFPVIYDAERTVLSLPPIINGAHSAISLDTTDVFIECTATDLNKAKIVLNTVVTMFSEYSANKFAVEPVDVVSSSGDERAYPDFMTRFVDVDPDYVRKRIGVTAADIDTKAMAALLCRMQLPTKIDGDVLRVEVPPTRSDILHPCDVAEDVAIAYGYNNINKEKAGPNVVTVGAQQPLNNFSDLVRQEMASQGFSEVLTWILCSHDDNFANVNREDDGDCAAIVANPSSLDVQVARSSLLQGVLKAMGANKDAPVPAKLFEVGDVVLLDESKDVGARNSRRLLVLYSNTTSGFEVAHGALDRVMQITGAAKDGDAGYTLDTSLNEATYFPGRQAGIVRDGKRIGVMGVVHPTVLGKFDIVNPCSVLELDLEPFVDIGM